MPIRVKTIINKMNHPVQVNFKIGVNISLIWRPNFNFLSPCITIILRDARLYGLIIVRITHHKNDEDPISIGSYFGPD